MRKKIISSLPLVFAAFLAVSISGCVNLKKTYPDVRTYALNTSEAAHSDFNGTPVSVQIRPFTAVPAFADLYVVYRTGETSYESDFYNQLVYLPAPMVTDQVQQWLKSSPVFSYVLQSRQDENTDYTLEGRILELYGDYRDQEHPKAVVKVQLTVSVSDEELEEVSVMQKIYSQTIDMPRISPEVLVNSWNRALSGIVKEFEGDFIEFVKKNSQDAQ